jgi:lipid A 3-O-deacylase
MVVSVWGMPGLCGAETLGHRWWEMVRGQVPHQTAVGLYGGMAYDGSALGFGLVSWQALYDYEDIWIHPAPEGLGFRLEGTVGAAGRTEFSGPRSMASAGFLAVYERPGAELLEYHPYVEAGVGIAYTDFQREGQGLRMNFNPVAGVGLRRGKTFMAIRLHHLSNAGLDHDNRGINSVVLGIGWILGAD